jgi:hypothetical protein
MPTTLEIFRQAVREAIASAHKAGLPAYQGINGYIVAIYPDGRRVRLEKLIPADRDPLVRHVLSKNHDRRGTQRRRKNDVLP